jgi:hypothetical protein
MQMELNMHTPNFDLVQSKLSTQSQDVKQIHYLYQFDEQLSTLASQI